MTYEIKYRREDEMKDSGIEWLGKIPRCWCKTDMIKALDAKIADGPHETPEYVDDGIPFISVDSINESDYVDLDIVKKFISYKQYIEYNKKTKLQKNDILFTKSATIGKVAIVDERTFMTWSPLAIIKSNNKVINYKLLYNILKSSRYIDYIKSLSNLNTQLNIGMGVLEKSIITYSYDLNEQQKIANFLDLKTTEFDSIISKKELLIKKLEQAKKSLISEVVTGNVKIVDGELVEREPDEMKDSGVQWLGMIPKDWEVARLKNFMSITGGNAFSTTDFDDDGIQVLKIANLYQNELALERQPTFIANNKVKLYSRFLVSQNDILISLTGTLGKRDYGFAILLDSANKYLLNQRVGKLVLKSDIVLEYILFILRSEFYLSQLYSYPSGTKQANLSNDDVLRPIAIIPRLKDEQYILSQYLSNQQNNINSIITKTKLQIQKLKQAKQSLISECVTGKIDLRDWEIQ